jgi:antitoxin VapB
MEAIMGMNIKNERVERLARELAKETGETITSAIQHALEMRLERVRKGRDIERRKRDLDEFLAKLPPPPPGVTSDHSDLYDEWGLPK